jgi:hypothetical protein
MKKNVKSLGLLAVKIKKEKKAAEKKDTILRRKAAREAAGKRKVCESGNI